MFKVWNKFFNWIHYHMPLWIGRIYMPFVYLVRHLRDLWVSEFLIEGKLQGSESVLKLGYYGNDKRIFCYWVNSVFSETFRIEEKKKIAVWKVAGFRQEDRSAPDLALMEVSGITRRFNSTGKGYLLPRWVDTILRVETSVDTLNCRSNLKNIRKRSFSYRETRSFEDLHFFYERMYRPYILDRHKDASVMVDYSFFRKRMKSKHSRLFMLLQGDEPVAASFAERMNGRIRLSGIGVLDGRRDIIQTGAIRALYYFMLNYYKEQGVDLIDFGGTSPLLTDGLTKFKRSLKAVPTDRNPYGEKSLWLIPVKNSVAARSFLNLHPFLFLEKGRFYRALFPDSSVVTSREDFLEWTKHAQFHGISGTKIFSNHLLLKLKRWITQEGLTGYEVLPFEYFMEQGTEPVPDEVRKALPFEYLGGLSSSSS